MGFTVYKSFPFTFHGQANNSFGPIPEVTSNSRVFASITEVLPTDPVVPFIGAAKIGIHNIAPKDDHFVDMWVSCEWPADIRLQVSILVHNP
jgi:hypothetical protein